MEFEILTAIETIAKRHNMCMVHVIKWFTAEVLVNKICRELKLEEWEYGIDVFNSLKNIARISGITNIGQLNI